MGIKTISKEKKYYDHFDYKTAVNMTIYIYIQDSLVVMFAGYIP